MIHHNDAGVQAGELPVKIEGLAAGEL